MSGHLVIRSAGFSMLGLSRIFISPPVTSCVFFIIACNEVLGVGSQCSVINNNIVGVAAAQGFCTSLAASSAHPHTFELHDQL